MITTAAALRSEPQLRQAIMSAGMDGIMALTARKASVPVPTTTPDIASLQALMQQAQSQMLQPQATQPSLSRNGVRVNRLGFTQGNGVQFQPAPSQTQTNPASDTQSEQTQAMADQLGRLLQGLRVGQ